MAQPTTQALEKSNRRAANASRRATKAEDKRIASEKKARDATKQGKLQSKQIAVRVVSSVAGSVSLFGMAMLAGYVFGGGKRIAKGVPITWGAVMGVGGALINGFTIMIQDTWWELPAAIVGDGLRGFGANDAAAYGQVRKAIMDAEKAAAAAATEDE